MFKTISNKHLKQPIFIIVTCFALTLFLISIYSFYSHFKTINELDKKYQTIENIALSSLHKRKERIDFLNKYKNSNPTYLIDFFNKKKLLSEKQNNLNYLNFQPFFYKNPNLVAKITKINENKFDYLVGDSFEKKNIKETKIALKYPILCSYTDLIEILSAIDNVTINQVQANEKSPQLVPCDLYIEFNDDNCVFDCKLLQREFK